VNSGARKDGLARKLVIASAHPDIEKHIALRMEDYPGFLERFKKEGPSLEYRALEPSGDSLGDFKIYSALSVHGLPNYAYKLIDRDGRKLAISGDGALSEDTRRLFEGADLLVHEGFYVNASSKNHASTRLKK